MIIWTKIDIISLIGKYGSTLWTFTLAKADSGQGMQGIKFLPPGWQTRGLTTELQELNSSSKSWIPTPSICEYFLWVGRLIA